MAITSRDDYINSARQWPQITKTAGRTTVAAAWFSAFDLAGSPGAGTLAGTSAAAGVVPTDAVAGYPSISSFGAGIGYIAGVEFSNTVACRIRLYDRLFVCGAHAFNAAQALASQPAYSARLPGTNYSGLEIWVEQVTAATGNQAVNVTYMNQAGTTGKTTGATGIGAAPTVGRCWQLPLAAGDTGVQKIENVAGSVATVGTFNVMVLRRLWAGRVPLANGGDVHDLFRCGMPQLYEDSALFMLVAPDSTALGVPDLEIEVASK